MTTSTADQLAAALARIDELERAFVTFQALEPTQPASALQLQNMQANVEFYLKRYNEIAEENALMRAELGRWKSHKARKLELREMRRIKSMRVRRTRLNDNEIPF